MPPYQRAVRSTKKREVDEIDLSFLSDDEDVLLLTQSPSKAAKGKAAVVEPRSLYTNVKHSQRSASRSTSSAAHNSASRPVSSAGPKSARANQSTARRGKLSWKPLSRQSRNKETRRRRQRSDSFVEDDEDEAAVWNDSDEEVDEVEESDDDSIIVDEISSSRNAGALRSSVSRPKRTPKNKPKTAPRSFAKSKSSRLKSPAASTSTRKPRPPPRQRYPLRAHTSDEASEDQDEGDLSAQASDSLEEELNDSSDEPEPPRRSTRQQQSNGDKRAARSNGRAKQSRSSDARLARTRRALLLDDDDEEDNFEQEFHARKSRGGRASQGATSSRRRRRRLPSDDKAEQSQENEDDEEDQEEESHEEDDDVQEDEDEDEEDEEEEEEEEEENEPLSFDDSDEYVIRVKRKKSMTSKSASASKRRRISERASNTVPRRRQSRAVPRRKATVKRTRSRKFHAPKLRFALQGELPEPFLDSPTQAEIPFVTIDEALQSTDLKGIPFLEDIDAGYSSSVQSSEAESGDQDSHTDKELVSDAKSVSSSDEIEPYREPEAHIDRHWSGCKRCADGPPLPLYNKALVQLKRLQSREAKKQRKKSPERVGSSGRARKALVDDTWGAFTAVQAAEEWVEVLEDRGGWFECKTCSVSWHWGCLPQDTQKAILARINRETAMRHRSVFGEKAPAPPPVRRIDIDEMVQNTDSCPDCAGYASFCTLCKADVRGVRSVEEQLGFTKAMLDQYPPPPAELTSSKLFRCKRCSRATHYECLARTQTDATTSVEEAAKSIQDEGWLCSDCHRWPAVDKIIAWRQLDRSLWSDEEAKRADYATLSPRENLPREYLVKFKGQSFRQTEWVPHDWLRILHQYLLQAFLAKGSRLELEPAELVESSAALASARRSRASLALGGGRALPSAPIQTRSVKKTLKVDETGEVDIGPPGPVPDAQHRIPKPWKTPDRILAVKYYFSIRKDDDDEPGGEMVDSDSIPLDKLEPSDYLRSWVHVAKLFIKWQDQPYETSTWEDPPTRRKQADIFYECQEAYRSFLTSQKVTFPALTSEEKRIKRERRLAKSGTRFRALEDQPHCIEGGDLIDFQLEGVNWLRYGWYNQKPGILADEMGLGKTVQIITFLASIWKEGKAGPFLVVVPNSTLPNWMREFEKWMPQFRVVPYWGEVEGRDMIAKYEFFHSKKMLANKDEPIRPIKFHVVVAADSTVRQDSLPLRKAESWDVIIVDEGQNLKSGKSLLMKRLNELHAEHRVIMTGTPLNNNVTELFNLLNWLEPGGQWKDVKALENEYSVLKPEVIEELQKRLKPYFLRRLKKEVLDLPPKVELIVPTSLRPIQKRIYRSILESNVEDIQALAASRETGGKKGKKSTIANLNNTLMQLRKCIQHPYLIAPDLETREGEANYEATWEHQRLIDASAKLSLLQRLLPKLKANGHRILLFSQFVINLDIVEVFLRGEGYKFLRLDGEVGQKQRQKGIDAFNAPDSPYFIYMISTRAGGVGINLATADTVIIMDPDWNPHVDMQAIARAHRIGQTKKLLVFTLMCKATAEERIIEGAKRKMVLDHLIVQNMNQIEERPEQLESILKFGAQALFAEGGTEESERDIRYTDEDLDSLLQRRQDAADDDDQRDQKDRNDATGEPKGNFSYARVWEAEQADNADGVAPTAVVDDDFWADLLQKHREDAARRAEEEREKQAQEKRASRRDRIRAMLEVEEANKDPPPAPTKRGPGRPRKVPKHAVDEDFNAAHVESDSDEGELIGVVQEEDELLPAVQALRHRQKQASNAALAASAAAAKASASRAAANASSVASTSTVPAAALVTGGSAVAAVATRPAPITLPAKGTVASPASAAAKRSKSSLTSFASLQRELIAEHRLPGAVSLADIDLSLPTATVRPGHLAAMRRVLLSILPDSEFAREAAARSLSGSVPNLSPPDLRFQLTNTHINYYMQTFNVPRALFEAAFSIVAEDSIPAAILALPHGGAIALDWRKIGELLLRAATYMMLALRRPKNELPWRAAIEEWNKTQIGKPPPVVIEIADSPPSKESTLPPPTLQSAEAAAGVLKDRSQSENWLKGIAACGDAELTRIAQLVTLNPLSTPSANLMWLVQNYADGKGPKPQYGPAKLAIRAGMRASDGFVDPDVMGPPTSTAGAKPSSSSAASASPSASQSRPNRVAAALSRLSAFSGGSPARSDVSKKELNKLNLDVAVSYRKPRIKSSRSSVGGSPRTSIGLSPSPSLSSLANDGSPPVGTLDGGFVAGDEVEEAAPIVISAQTCIICGGEFHYLNRCPEMQDVTRASARWFQLCDQLRVLTARGLMDGDPDVATIKTTIKVMARKLNGPRVQAGQRPLVPPFA